MEQINTIALGDPGVYPDEEVLKRVLEKSYAVYEKLLELFTKHQLEHEWRYYKDGKAWLCKVQKGKRTIVWMSAWKGFMKATVYFPEKYVDGIYQLELKAETIQSIKDAKNVGKSKPCMFEIRNSKVLNDMEAVIRYKIESK